MHEAAFTLDCETDAEAGRVEAVLRGERFQDKRLAISISRQGSKILIQMHAKDVVMLRAAINSCLRSVQLVDSIKEVD